MPICIQETYSVYRPTLLPTPKIDKAAIFSTTLEWKTRIEPFAYYSISKGFEMVTCDVGILYWIGLLYQPWSIRDELKEDLYDSIQYANIKGNHFIVNWLTHYPHDCSIDLIFGNIAHLFQPMEVLSHVVGRSVFGKHTLTIELKIELTNQVWINS